MKIPLNSKVFGGLIVLLMIVVMTFVSSFKDIQIEVFYSLLTFAVALFGLSAITFKGKQE